VKALIVDDMPDLRDLLQVILEGFGIEAAQASNGKAALETIKAQGHFDFCTVDILMPVMDGFSFVEAVRKDPSLDKMKLLMVTTEVEKASVDKALRLGANEYLMKPYTKDLVEGKLRLLGLLT
jgi:two-component system chemotaxis response regulator CheY